MDISNCVVCECTGKTYKNIKIHQKSQTHQAWVTRNELRELKIELTRKDNKILFLEDRVAKLQDLNNALVSRIVSVPDNSGQIFDSI